MHIKLITIKACIIAACFASSISSVKANEYDGDGQCINYVPSTDMSYHSKYDELIKYEDWNLDDLMNYFQWGYMGFDVDSDEYKLNVNVTFQSEEK